MRRHTRQPFVAFCEQVLRLVFTLAWRVLLMVAIDGVQPKDLHGEEREMARTLFGNVDEIPPSLRRVLIWTLGRASGKTTVAAALVIWMSLTADLQSVGRGQVPCSFVVSPSKPTAKIALTIARELVRGTEVERLVVDKGDTADGFLLRRHDGRTVAVRCVAASRGGANLRGVDVLMLIVDESEFMTSGADHFAITDADQLSAVMPRLIGHALLISTPWPVDTVTGELRERNFGHPVDGLAAMGPSMLMRPTERLREDIERERARDPENAAREYELDTGGRGGQRLIDPADIMAGVVEGRPLVVLAGAGWSVACGGDLGLERDSSVAAAVGRNAEEFTLLEFDEVRPTKGHPLSPGYVVKDRFVPLMDRHSVRSIMMDAHYRQSAIEHLGALGYGFDDAPTGQQGKYDSYMFVRALLRERRLKIPASPRLLAQLRAVTVTPMPGGGTKISSPRRAGSGHGDIVSALVLACWAAREGASSVIPAMEQLQRSGGLMQWLYGSESPPYFGPDSQWRDNGGHIPWNEQLAQEAAMRGWRR